MNLLQVNKLYYPEVGGVEQVVQDIAEAFSGSHTSRVLAARPQGLGRHERHNGVEVVKSSSLGVAMSLPIAPTFPIRLQSAARSADIVHHHLPNPLSTVSQLAATTGDTPVVATYHSDIVRQSNALRVYRPVLDRFLSRVDRIVVTSERLMRNSDVVSKFSEKCEVVPLSVDLGAIDDEKSVRPDVDTGDPIVLFAGRLNYYKGVEYLVDAMTDVDATLLVVGDGERRAALERRARTHDVHDRVHFLGHLPEPQLAGAYRAADVFALPSVEPSEAFGIVQLEAMARSTPVVNTSLPTGVPWVSQDGETGLTVPPRDSTALADAISTLLDDDERRREYAERARKRVEREFTEEKMIDHMERIYEDLLTGE